LQLAGDALAFFDARQIWECIFRGNVVAARASSDSARLSAYTSSARNALNQLKSLWPSEDLTGYLGRPDIKRLTERVQL
jgi:hypothetical protein